MKTFPWKRSLHPVFRYWVVPNSLRAFDDCPDAEQLLVVIRRRHAALWRLVERPRCAYLGKCNSSRCPRHGAEMRRTP